MSLGSWRENGLVFLAGHCLGMIPFSSYVASRKSSS
jgi:hypothetical protein